MEEEHHLLIVDDNDEDVAEISAHISAAVPSFVISHVRSGEEALHRLKNHKYHVCLVDIFLPGMGGIEFIEYILKHGDNLPVIVISDRGNEKSVVKAIKCGAYDYLLKSELDAPLLGRTIERAIKDNKTRREKEQLQEELEAYTHQLEKLVEERTKEIEYLNSYKELILGNLDVYVRVVDPEKKIVQYESSKMRSDFGGNEGAPCHGLLGKSEECEFCISKEAIEKWEVSTKEERVGDITFSISSIPLKNMDGTFSAIEVIRDITEHKQSDLERERLLGKLSGRVKELDCLYNVSRIMAESRVPLEETFNKVLSILPPAWRFPDFASASLLYEEEFYSTQKVKESQWKLSSEVIASGSRVGELTVYYDSEVSSGEAGAFTKEEKYLLDAVAHQLGNFIERKKAEEELSQKSRLAAMGEMSSHLGHEIRGPLHRLGLSYEILRESPTVQGADRNVVETIGNSLDVLFSIANDLLDYSRKGKLNREHFDLVRITDITLSELREQIRQKSIEVNKNYLTDICHINADKLKIHQVLFNVMSNAIQAMTDGGRLGVEILDKDDHVEIRISDSGVGMSKEAFDKVFVPFYTTKTGGTGLGMPIVKHFVELHKGGILIESKEGEGTLVDITLPLNNHE